MEVVHDRCAGMDVSKRDVKVCLRLPGSRRGSYTKSVTTFGSVTAEILRLREHLVAAGVTLVVMEATGAYWKPFYYLLEDAPFELMLVNPSHAKGLPGRKTYVSDAPVCLLNSAGTAWSGAPWFLRSRSASCATSPAPG